MCDAIQGQVDLRYFIINNYLYDSEYLLTACSVQYNMLNSGYI